MGIVKVNAVLQRDMNLPAKAIECLRVEVIITEYKKESSFSILNGCNPTHNAIPASVKRNQKAQTKITKIHSVRTAVGELTARTALPRIRP